MRRNGFDPIFSVSPLQNPDFLRLTRRMLSFGKADRQFRIHTSQSA